MDILVCYWSYSTMSTLETYHDMFETNMICFKGV